MSVREVVEGLADRRPASTTVSTVLENLRRKEWVDREQVGRLRFCRPPRDRAAHAAGIISGALADSGDPHATPLRFVEEMSAEGVDVCGRCRPTFPGRRRRDGAVRVSHGGAARRHEHGWRRGCRPCR